MSEALQLLGGLTVEQFLADYWQKQPLLVRGAFPGFQSPLSADELAGLACEAEVESRLVLEKHGPAPWTVEHGPFDESRFASLPGTHWTLLVQGVDSWVPEVASLIEPFRFIPDWRIDDIMMSYAPEHGSVGPHLDQYDVFLIQAQGHRHWQINTRQYDKGDCIPGISLNILQGFEAEQAWTLAPGDMLYLPPNIAHYGVAQDDCITCSVGFRAPARSEILGSFIDDLLPRLDETERYQDQDLTRQQNPGEISAQALARIRDIVRLKALDNQYINHWFARYITEPKYQADYETATMTRDTLLKTLDSHEIIYRDAQSRFAYISEASDCFLFVNGEEFPCDCEFAQFICQAKQYPSQALASFMSTDNRELVLHLFNHHRLLTTNE
jgi:50S ribosomal protein L16 3-hydroxylase